MIDAGTMHEPNPESYKVKILSLFSDRESVCIVLSHVPRPTHQGPGLINKYASYMYIVVDTFQKYYCVFVI